MKTRRDFFKTAVAVGLLATDSYIHAETKNVARSMRSPTVGADLIREKWCGIAGRIANPLLAALVARELKKRMPVEAHPSSSDRAEYSHLEALARLLTGVAPWLELGRDESPESKLRADLAAQAREGIDAATDPKSPDFLNFSRGKQPLVDTAFLAQAMRRAPNELWAKLDTRVRKNVVAALTASRVITAGENNWKLFASTIEVFLRGVGERYDKSRLFEGLSKHRSWYLGDGIYGDGPHFHWDYYNAFVIQPILLESLEAVANDASEWADFLNRERARFSRYADLQERLIAPDGSYPAIGRSITYRCGAFQVLAMAAWRDLLPARITPGQARVALDRVIARTLEAPGTFDQKGWLKIGLIGSQPQLGETYISTGSLYLCTAALLPLGLHPSAPFWSEPPLSTSWERIWSGQNESADHALKE